MGYEKAMKWSRKNPKGISYKRGYMGFNPSGITAQQMDAREAKYIAELREGGEALISETRKGINSMRDVWPGSWPWEWCVFQRHFGLHE